MSRKFENKKNFSGANAPDASRSVDTTSSPLREYELFAIDKNGDVVSIGITCSFFLFGAERVAQRLIKNMTHVERLQSRLAAKAKTFAVERIL
jgi:hypothetical protein